MIFDFLFKNWHDETSGNKPPLVSPKKAGLVIPEFNNFEKDYDSNFYLGNIENIGNYCINLFRCPHMLISGVTRSGKSVFIESLLYSYLYNLTPAQLKLYIIDPKKVDYIAFKEYPHLKGYADNIKDAETIVSNLLLAMESRYKEMQKNKVPKADLIGLNHIICVFDEYGTFDKSKIINNGLKELSRLGAAANIHLIIATQLPTRETINNVLKANCPARVAFKVPTKSNSRIIIDQSGAEMLRGKGDGLITFGDGNLYRFQGLMLSDESKQKIYDYWR